MKKKGFTLIEMICVIAFLSIIITLSTISIVNGINDNRKKQNEATLKLIYSATSEYIQKYENKYEKGRNASYCIKIADLINDGVLVKKLQYDDKQIDVNKYVSLNYIENKFEYELVSENSCTETKKHIINNLIKNNGFEKGKDDWEVNTHFTASIATNKKMSGMSSLKLTVNAGYTSSSQLYQTVNLDNNHKYYFSAYTNTHTEASDTETNLSISPIDNWNWIASSTQTSPTQDTWIKNSLIYNNIDYTSARFRINLRRENSLETSVGDTIYIDDIIVIDLTQSFGAGNEPDKTWCDNNILYFIDSTAVYK